MISKFKLPFLAILFLLPIFGLSAQECDPDLGYCPLTPLEGSGLTNETGNVSVNTFIPNLVKLTIGIAGGLAVIMIIVGGIQYMSTDAWGQKNDAKDRIRNALLGLLLAIGAYTILATVNPKLVDIEFSIPRQVSTTTIDVNIPGTTSKSAEETGCTNDCEAIDPNQVPVKTPGACSNNPCYAHEDIQGKLDDLADDMVGKAGWQVIRAYPPILPQGAAQAPCYTSGTSAGKCVEVALTVSNTENIISFTTELLNNFGPTFKAYYICPQARVDAIKSSSQFNSISDPNIKTSLLSRIQCLTIDQRERAELNI